MAATTPRRAPPALALGLLCLAGGGGCLQVLNIEDDRYVSNARWACYAEAPPTVASQQAQLFIFDLLNTASLRTNADLRQGPPVPNATVFACPPFDPSSSCGRALGGPWTTGADGQATIELPAGFAGYLEVKVDGFLSQIMYDDRFRTGVDPNSLIFGYLINNMFAGASLGIFDVPFDIASGFIYAEVYDCQGQFVNGVSFDIERATEKTRSFYTVDGIPNTAASETYVRGGGFFNAPVGSYRLNARLSATGEVVGSKTINVRAGTQTTVVFGPVVP